jgi:hypothetical protein
MARDFVFLVFLALFISATHRRPICVSSSLHPRDSCDPCGCCCPFSNLTFAPPFDEVHIFGDASWTFTAQGLVLGSGSDFGLIQSARLHRISLISATPHSTFAISQLQTALPSAAVNLTATMPLVLDLRGSIAPLSLDVTASSQLILKASDKNLTINNSLDVSDCLVVENLGRNHSELKISEVNFLNSASFVLRSSTDLRVVAVDVHFHTSDGNLSLTFPLDRRGLPTLVIQDTTALPDDISVAISADFLEFDRLYSGLMNRSFPIASFGCDADLAHIEYSLIFPERGLFGFTRSDCIAPLAIGHGQISIEFDPMRFDSYVNGVCFGDSAACSGFSRVISDGSQPHLTHIPVWNQFVEFHVLQPFFFQPTHWVI